MIVSGAELLVLIVVAVVLIGPERLPEYSRRLAALAVRLKRLTEEAPERVRAELGPEFDDFDFAALDPRRYDPRRIVREALAEPTGTADSAGSSVEPRRLERSDDAALNRSRRSLLRPELLSR